MAQNILDTVIENQYLDIGNFDVYIKLPDPYDGGPGALLISSVSGANAFLVGDNGLRTPELSITAYVTKKQDSLLRHLYVATVHPGYIDQTHPVKVEWGDVSKSIYAKPGSDADGLLNDAGVDSHDFYLASYTPPSSVDFSRPEMLPVSLVLRLI